MLYVFKKQLKWNDFMFLEFKTLMNNFFIKFENCQMN